MYKLNCTIKGTDLFVDGHRVHLNPLNRPEYPDDSVDNIPAELYNGRNQRRKHVARDGRQRG